MQGPHSLVVAPHKHLNEYVLPDTKMQSPVAVRGWRWCESDFVVIVTGKVDTGSLQMRNKERLDFEGGHISTKPRPRPFAPCTELTILWLVAPQTRPQPAKMDYAWRCYIVKSTAKLQSLLQSANWDQYSTEHCFVECKGPAPWDPSSRCNLAKKCLK